MAVGTTLRSERPMRNLAGRPNPLDRSRGFSGPLHWRARGPGSLRSTGEWRGLVRLALAMAGISGCAWSPSFERSPLGDSVSPHSIGRPSAVETWRSELSAGAIHSFPRPYFTTHIKRRRPTRWQSEPTRMVAEGSEEHLFRLSTPRQATVRAAAANLVFQEFHDYTTLKEPA